jgi:hypothetical protein
MRDLKFIQRLLKVFFVGAFASSKGTNITSSEAGNAGSATGLPTM